MTLPTPREIRHLDTGVVGRHVLHFGELDSTNTAAGQLAGGYAEGLVVIADHQTAGRGQYGRVWNAPPGSSLLMSVALRPPREISRPVILTALAAVAVGDAILALAGRQSRIKWPNDLLLEGKKVCGILIETTTATAIGIGLNLSQTADELTAAGLPHATSLAAAAGRPVSLAGAAEIVIRKLDAEYTRLLRGERIPLEADWKWRIGLLGKTVAAELSDGGSITGRLREMSFDQLELETDRGRVELLPERVRHLTAETL